MAAISYNPTRNDTHSQEGRGSSYMAFLRCQHGSGEHEASERREIKIRSWRLVFEYYSMHLSGFAPCRLLLLLPSCMISSLNKYIPAVSLAIQYSVPLVVLSTCWCVRCPATPYPRLDRPSRPRLPLSFLFLLSYVRITKVCSTLALPTPSCLSCVYGCQTTRLSLHASPFRPVVGTGWTATMAGSYTRQGKTPNVIRVKGSVALVDEMD